MKTNINYWETIWCFKNRIVKMKDKISKETRSTYYSKLICKLNILINSGTSDEKRIEFYSKAKRYMSMTKEELLKSDVLSYNWL